MQVSLLSNGNLRVQDQSGAVREIGPEHPDYQRLRAQSRTAKTNRGRTLLIGAAAMIVGVGAWWMNWHSVATSGEYSVKASLLGPLGLFGGLLMMLRPEWVGPVRNDSTRQHKMALFVLIGLVAVASGIDMYLLMHYQP